MPATGSIFDENATGTPNEVPDVSIFIVAFNSADFISDCLGAIDAALAGRSCEILLVDNGDGSTEAKVAREFPEVRIVPSKGNIGFAAGNNLLAAHARSDMYLLLNPDMIAAPGSIGALLKGAENHPAAAAWGGVSLGKDGQPDTGNALAIPTLHELRSVALGKSAIGSGPIKGLDKDAEVDVLMGGLVMFRKLAWDAAKGLDERFFLYCEEVDLFYRLGLLGYTFWRIPDAKGIHDAAHGNAFSPTRQLYRTTGIMEFARHHWRLPQVLGAAALIWIAAIARYVAGGLFGRWRPRLRSLHSANRLVATRPSLWIYGYDPKKGLTARLSENPNVLS